jgi:hypothetical protein
MTDLLAAPEPHAPVEGCIHRRCSTPIGVTPRSSADVRVDLLPSGPASSGTLVGGKRQLVSLDESAKDSRRTGKLGPRVSRGEC